MRKPRKPVTLDAMPSNQQLGGDKSIGAQVWEVFHPEQVQAEYAAMGKAVPSKAAIIAQAHMTPSEYLENAIENFNTSMDAVEDAAERATQFGGEYGKYILFGVGVVAALALMNKVK